MLVISTPGVLLLLSLAFKLFTYNKYKHILHTHFIYFLLLYNTTTTAATTIILLNKNLHPPSPFPSTPLLIFSSSFLHYIVLLHSQNRHPTQFLSHKLSLKTFLLCSYCYSPPPFSYCNVDNTIKFSCSSFISTHHFPFSPPIILADYLISSMVSSV